MGENTKIEWATNTFNPWVGCTAVSPACKFCYAEAQDKHRGWTPEGWGKGKPRKRTSAANWKKPLAWNRKAKEEGTRPRVFCASLADVFDAEVSEDWRDDLWELICECDGLDWLLLTKRPQNVYEMVPYRWLDGGWPIHIWLGTTVEDQRRANERIPALLEYGAPVSFLSCEPLLGPVDLSVVPANLPGAKDDYFNPLTGHGYRDIQMREMQPDAKYHRIDWVICGGESGSHARPMLPGWAVSLRDQCVESGVPYLFKQWGEWGPVLSPEQNCKGQVAAFDITGRRKGLNEGFDPGAGDAFMAKEGKKRAGRLLDGRTWDEVPVSPAFRGSER